KESGWILPHSHSPSSSHTSDGETVRRREQDSASALAPYLLSMQWRGGKGERRHARRGPTPLPSPHSIGRGLGGGVRFWCFLVPLIAAPAFAQDRLKTMPGYQRFERMSRELNNAAKLGGLSVTWKDGGNAFEYQKDGKH